MLSQATLQESSGGRFDTTHPREEEARTHTLVEARNGLPSYSLQGEPYRTLILAL